MNRRLPQILSNYTLLALGSSMSKVFTFLTFIFLARKLGPEQYGNIEFTIGLQLFFALLVDFGSGSYGAREIAKDKSRLSEVISSIICVRALLAVFSYVALVLVSNTLSRGNEPFRTLILIYGITILAGPGLIEFVFQGLEKMKWVAAVSIIRQFVFAAGVFLFVRKADQLWMAGVIACVSSLAVLVYNFYMLAKHVGPVSFRWQWSSMARCFNQSLPLGLSQLTWFTIWYSAPVFLGLMSGQREVGFFGAAYRPVMSILTFVALYFYNLLPAFSRYSVEASPVAHKLMAQSMRITSWFGVFLAIAALMLSKYSIVWIFGKSYGPSVLPFEILIWSIPVALISGHYRSALIAFNYQKHEFLASTGGLVSGLLLGFFLAPKYQAVGSAIAILSAVLVNGVLAYYFARTKIAELPTVWTAMQPVAASGVILAGFYLLSNTAGFLVAFATGMTVFLFLLLLLNPQIRRLEFVFTTAPQ